MVEKPCFCTPRPANGEPHNYWCPSARTDAYEAKPCGHLLPCSCTQGSDPNPPYTRKPGRDLAADEEHAPGCIRDHFGPGTHTCEPIPIEDFDAPSDVKPTPEQLAAAHAELTGAAWDAKALGVKLPERIPALDAAEHEAQVPEMLKIGLKCTCTGPEIPDGGEHQDTCPRWRPTEDPFTSNRVGDSIGAMTRHLVREQARVRENVARSAVTYVLDEMGRAIDTIRHSVLEQPEKLAVRRSRIKQALVEDLRQSPRVGDLESVTELAEYLLTCGWTKDGA